MHSLRVKIAALAALVAMLATSVSALAGVYSTRHSVREQQERTALLRLEDVRLHLRNLSAMLAFEVQDYAEWDELYEQMPSPSSAWTTINLRPGHHAGQICQVFVLTADQALIGRYRADDQRRVAPAAGDPAHASSLLPLAALAPGAGLALVDGLPILWASRSILHSDKTGKPRGHLLGIAYFDSHMLDRFRLAGWDLTVQAETQETSGPSVVFRSMSVSASSIEPALDGGVRITVSERDALGESLIFRANNAIVLAGVITALFATLVGVALGFHWVRPIYRLADACRRRVQEPDHVLPIDTSLSEATILSSALKALTDAEQCHRTNLAAALDRETTANAVQRRFLAQLGQEFGDPLRHLIASVDHLVANDGRLPPEEVAATRQVALLLEARLQEVLGLAAENAPESLGSEQDLNGYLTGISEALRLVATRRNVTIQIDAPPDRVLLDTRLLTPLLVNLATNAIAATSHGLVTLCARQTETGGTWWTITDTGCGLPAALTAAFANAGTQNGPPLGLSGLGLGLTLALANLRALNGRIQVVATGPTGTTLRVELPTHRSASALIQRMHTPPGPVRYIR